MLTDARACWWSRVCHHFAGTHLNDVPARRLLQWFFDDSLPAGTAAVHAQFALRIEAAHEARYPLHRSARARSERACADIPP